MRPRRLWAAIFAPLLALGFFLVGSPAANAFGAEVLGCSFDSYPWYAGYCEGGGLMGRNNFARFVPHNMTGTYTMAWTVTGPNGALSSCSSSGGSCISSGCTATSTTCTLLLHPDLNYDHAYDVTLKLVQSGLTKTIQAEAVEDATGGCVGC